MRMGCGDLLRLLILLYFIKGEARELSDAEILQCFLLSKNWGVLGEKKETDVTGCESKLWILI